MRKHIFASLVSASTILGAALTCSAPARAADVVITEEARTHFAAGVALLQDPKEPRYEEAYREFKAAYAAAPSYKILGNLGLCAMKNRARRGSHQRVRDVISRMRGRSLRPRGAHPTRTRLAPRSKSGIVQVTVSSEPPLGQRSSMCQQSRGRAPISAMPTGSY